MIEKWLSASSIAKLLGKDKRVINRGRLRNHGRIVVIRFAVVTSGVIASQTFLKMFKLPMR
jgi:hypothetical protein